MTKIKKGQERQTMVDKNKSHRKLNTEQHEPHLKTGAPEG